MSAGDRGAAAAARVGWVDVARGIGIVLVVVGHTLPGLWNAGVLRDGGPARALVDWIYAFHMPLFFFLSGLFAARTAAEPYRDLVAGKLRTIAYPYLVWSVLQTLVQVAVSGTTNTPQHLGSLLGIAYRPIMQFWFLYALFVIALLAGALQRLGARPPLILALAVLLYAYPHVAPLGPWGVAYAVANNLLYFAAGMVAADALPRWLAMLSSRRALLIAAAGYAAVALAVVAGDDGPAWRPLVAMVGVGATVAVAAAIDRGGSGRILAGWGRASLQIYVAHSMASAGYRIVLQRLLGVSAALPHVVGGIAVGLFAPLALAWICDRLHFRYAFGWPTRRPRARTAIVAGASPAWSGR